MLSLISPEAQRSLSNGGVVVDPEMPSMTPYQAGLVPPGGFPEAGTIVSIDPSGRTEFEMAGMGRFYRDPTEMPHYNPGMGIITPDVTRELDRSDEGLDYLEGYPAALGQNEPLSLLGIPLLTWATVAGAATAGAATGAYLGDRRGRAMLGGAAGGLLGALLGVTIVSFLNRPAGA